LQITYPKNVPIFSKGEFMARNIYLKTVSIEEAIAKVQQKIDKKSFLGSKIVPSEQAIGMRLVAPLYARYSSPTFHAAAMDGIAVRARDTFLAREGQPLLLTPEKDFVYVNTGNPLPQGFDAVIMIEEVVELEDGQVSIEKPAFPWQHVRRIGEDIVAKELLFPARHLLSAYDVGVLLSAGIFEVEVEERLRLAIIPTGDEVLDFTLRPEPKPGEVVESNSQVLAGLARSWGVEVRRFAPVKDDFALLTQAVEEALNWAHIVVMGAGSSAGSKDFTRQVMESVGEVLVHGIKAMPGKPSLLGISKQGKLLVGAPGYPVSAVICFEYLLKPLVYWLKEEPLPREEEVEAILSRSLPSKLGIREFVRVGVGKVQDKYVAIPLPRGAGMITSLSRATGLLTIAENSEGRQEGERVKVSLLRPRREVENSLLVIGSHDNLLDVLKDLLRKEREPVYLFSGHVGSLGGLKAIAKGYAHLAGTHLFDPESGDYNFPFVQKLLGEEEVVLVNLAYRQQGLILPKGNPKKIQGLEDLRRKDIVFINRQKGAGTRILLDYHLQKLGISPAEIQGYNREEYTHMAVAVNVLTGTADCGLGILAAARALNLDFIPLVEERYDLLLKKDLLKDKRVQKLLALLQREEFKTRAQELGGYDLRSSGQVMQAKN